jgi:hypothetical protein
MTKKERKKYGRLPPKIAEYDTVSLGHGMYGYGGSIYNKNTIQNTLSACAHNDRSSRITLAGLKFLKPQICQQHPSRNCFITPGWHITRHLNLFSLTMGANSNVSSNKCVTIMALKPNQLQVTTYHTQANAIIERLHKVVNDMLRSFDLENENNHENVQEQEDNPFDYFLQSTAWLPSYYKHLSYNTAGNTMSTCVWQRYDPKFCFQSKLGLNTKKKTGHYQ